MNQEKLKNGKEELSTLLIMDPMSCPKDSADTPSPGAAGAMRYSPMGVHYQRCTVLSSSLTPRRCMFVFVLFLMASATFLRLIFTIRHAYSDYHIMTDDDGELVFLPQDVAFKHGAYCLDGSRPGIYSRKGINDGEGKWLIALPHSGWCLTKEECFQRMKEPMRGSTRGISPQLPFAGLLSSSKAVNPRFASWNMALIVSCDGSSFLGNSTNAQVHGETIYLRGAAIFQAAVDYLLKYSDLAAASEVLLYGAGSGAVGAVAHSSSLRGQLPGSVKRFSVLSDGGVFLETNDEKAHRFAQLHSIQNTQTAALVKCRKAHPVDSCLKIDTLTRYTKAPTLVYSSLFQFWPASTIYNIKCPVRGCSEKHGVKFLSRKKEDPSAASYRRYAGDALNLCHTQSVAKNQEKTTPLSFLFTFCEMPLLLLEDSNAAFERVKEHPLPGDMTGSEAGGQSVALLGGQRLYERIVSWYNKPHQPFVVCEGMSSTGNHDLVYAMSKAQKCL